MTTTATADRRVRRPAVAGSFYPADATRLATLVDDLLARAAREDEGGSAVWPEALIAPHAGYVYSGPVAARAWSRIAPARGTVERVVLLGPSHFVPFAGLALPSHDAFATPLGSLDVDGETVGSLRHLTGVSVRDDAHRREHSLEVHLPFVQATLGEPKLVPLVVGRAAAQEVGEVLEALWNGPETLIVVSTDLSHYHPYEAARRRDRRTAEAVEALRWEELTADDACGVHPLRGLLCLARRRDLHVHRLDLRNSADTAGGRSTVVGYGAWCLTRL